MVWHVCLNKLPCAHFLAKFDEFSSHVLLSLVEFKNLGPYAFHVFYKLFEKKWKFQKLLTLYTWISSDRLFTIVKFILKMKPFG
jgi:hypothetical protein